LIHYPRFQGVQNLSRKSPAPKSKPPAKPKLESDGTTEQRVAYLLDYITSINRQTLAALYQLYAAPDCQVGEVPALRYFGYLYAETNFRATALLTWPQEVVLQKAAEQSIEALVAEAFQVAITLFNNIVAAEQGLVTALMTPPASVKDVVPEDDPPPPPPLGCCYYNNGPPMSNVPQALCVNDPDYYSWDGGNPCLES
jgi:hypothetical protein